MKFLQRLGWAVSVSGTFGLAGTLIMAAAVAPDDWQDFWVAVKAAEQVGFIGFAVMMVLLLSYITKGRIGTAAVDYDFENEGPQTGEPLSSTSVHPVSGNLMVNGVDSNGNMSGTF